MPLVAFKAVGAWVVIMDIKGVNGYYSYRPVSSLPKKNAVQAEGFAMNRESSEGDQVLISSGASFKARLDNVSKVYASQAKEQCTVSSVRLNELKELYKGDEIPVSSTEVAGAIMGTVLGRGSGEF